MNNFIESRGNSVQEYVEKGRQENTWREGTEWADAERFVYEKVVEKARQLLLKEVVVNDNDAIAEAVKSYFGNRRYYNTKL